MGVGCLWAHAMMLICMALDRLLCWLIDDQPHGQSPQHLQCQNGEETPHGQRISIKTIYERSGT